MHLYEVVGMGKGVGMRASISIVSRGYLEVAPMPWCVAQGEAEARVSWERSTSPSAALCTGETVTSAPRISQTCQKGKDSSLRALL